MPVPVDELVELEAFGEISTTEEAGASWIKIKGLKLPAACAPASTDGLLCPTARDGYPSRLYLADHIQSPTPRSWNGNIHVLGTNWYAVSWKVSPDGKRLAQLLADHLDAFR
jgi:hypothetical protein